MSNHPEFGSDCSRQVEQVQRFFHMLAVACPCSICYQENLLEFMILMKYFKNSFLSILSFDFIIKTQYIQYIYFRMQIVNFLMGYNLKTNLKINNTIL